jgi:replicative DNA helicase
MRALDEVVRTAAVAGNTHDQGDVMDCLSVRVEQAMLGAVLSDPTGQPQVLDWLEPSDMCRPWHGQVLGAMQRLRGRGTPPGPLEVYAELQNDPDLPASVRQDAVLLADLMAAAPHTRHAQHYAAMVVEGGVRQRMRLAGSRMAQAAETGSLEAALHLSGHARQELNASRTRWLALPERLRRQPPAPARDEQAYAEIARRAVSLSEEITRLREDFWLEGPDRTEKRLAAVIQRLAETAAASADQRSRLAEAGTANQPRPQGPAAEAAGVRVLRDLAADSSQLPCLRGWLRPEHFARAEHGALYAVMQDLDAVGAPVDPLTVSWEASRRGVRADPASLAGGTAAFAIASGREVRRHGLLAQAVNAGRYLQAGAADPARGLTEFLQTASERLHALEAQAQRERASNPAGAVALVRGHSRTSVRARQAEREAAS